MRPVRARSGLTFIELLVVLGLLGLVLGLGAPSLIGAVRRAEVAEGARTFAADLERARGAAQKLSLTASLAWSAAAGQPITAYTLTRGPQTTPRAPSARVRLSCVALAGSACTLAGPRLNFEAPHAEASAGAVFEVRSARPGGPALYVKVTGVTGKVSISETQD